MTGVDMSGGIGVVKHVPEELRLLKQATTAVAEAGDVADALAQVARLVAEHTGWREAKAWLPHEAGPVPTVVAVAREQAKAVRAEGAVAVPILALDEVVAVLHFVSGADVDDASVEVVSLVAAELGAQVRRRRLEDRVAEVQRELERSNAELRAANSELRRSNADLAEFAYVASHDLSEPLRVIAGHVQLLARRYRGALDADADRYIDFAVDGCARMQSLITDLLEYARIGQSPLTSVALDANVLVAGVLASLPGVAEADVQVGALPAVQGDAGQLRQLFANLVSNALKFAAPETVPVVRIDAEVSGPMASFTVADGGIGVPARHRERIFRMFQRLHSREEYEGTGIGLAICRRIVERHGGTIAAGDTPGGGAAFTFTLPVAPRSA